jgi:flavin-dependent dehydrogenase
VTVEVVVVGGGPAGAITAALLARAGHEVVVLERSPTWRWRACGVFTSPAALPALERVGVPALSAAVARPIPAMRLETPRGSLVRLTYDGPTNDGEAVGLARGELDPLLLVLARDAGADVREGTGVRDVSLPAGGEAPSVTLADGTRIAARVVIGADGVRSMVARAAGVDRRSPLGPRVGLTFHIADPEAGTHAARIVVIEDGYVGLAPVPGRRLNVGIVLWGRWFDRLRLEGAVAVAREVLKRVLDPDGSHPSAEPLDPIAGASPLGGTVSRRAGAGWLVVGDAAGFIDPFTGEGLHRAIVSAELAAEVVSDRLRGRTGAIGRSTRAIDLATYDRQMRARFATKDVVSRLVQAFLARPALFEYAARRLARREAVRDTLAAVLGDLSPARLALDPRYLGALLRP